MIDGGKSIEPIHRCINDERYRKLKARLMRNADFWAEEEQFLIDGLILEGPSFDLAVDALPEPEEK